MKGNRYEIDGVALDRALCSLGWEGSEVEVEDMFLRRLLGFTFRSERVWSGRALVLVFPRCRAVHTCFMRFPLDIVGASREGEVCTYLEGVEPWRFVTLEGSFVLERASRLP